MEPNPKYSILALCWLFGFSTSFSSNSISPLKAGKNVAIKEGTSIHNKEGINK